MDSTRVLTRAGIESKSEYALSVTDVSFAYADGTKANDDITLTMRPGEFLCLLGPNGSGKTTLVRQIGGELHPRTGTIEIFGTNIVSDPATAKRHLGIVPQFSGAFSGLYPALSVKAHLVAFAHLHDLSGTGLRASVRRVIADCDLSELLNRQIRALSAGQQRKVLIALALLSDPAILLLDEPSVGLDPVVRRQFWLTLKRLSAGGKSILLTTHYMEEAETLGTRIAFIELGTINRSGTLEELYTALGKSWKVTLSDHTAGNYGNTHYFDSMKEARQFLTATDASEYSISRISLEDIYLRVFNHGENGVQ